MRPRADARLLVPLVMQRHMFCGRSVVLQCVSHGFAAPASSHHSRRTSGSQKEGRACRRGEKRVGDRRGPPIFSGSGSGTFACLLVLTKPAYTPRTQSQGLTVWPLLSRALEYARALEYEALHARKASKGLVVRRVQREAGRSGWAAAWRNEGCTATALPSKREAST